MPARAAAGAYGGAVPRGPSLARTRRTGPSIALVLAFFVLAGVSRATAPATSPPAVASVPPVASVPAPAPTREIVLPAAAPRHDLPVINYRRVPGGFPADPSPASTAAVTEAVHPTHRLPVYDAPGGRARAFLPPSILGVPVTVPIVARRAGWAAVLLPSVNRRIGWLPDRGWTAHPLRDQLLLQRNTHELTWLRDGRPREAWTVAIGASRTPTPLGRTFVLARTGTHGAVYAGLDALVLGAVPDDRDAVAPGLRDAHTGIHAWYRPSVFGHSVSNGCIRMPRAAQKTLLNHIAPGTTLVVRD